MSKAVFKLSDLITANETLIATEKANKEILETFNETTCSNNLHTWAASSFQPSFIIYQWKTSWSSVINTFYRISIKRWD